VVGRPKQPVAWWLAGLHSRMYLYLAGRLPPIASFTYTRICVVSILCTSTVFRQYITGVAQNVRLLISFGC